MASIIQLMMLILTSSLIILATSAEEDPELQFLQNLYQGSNHKAVKLHFYLQDLLAGKQATVWEVSRCSITDESPSSFGQLKVLDDLVTETPDPASTTWGRAQGLITSCDLAVSALTMNVNFVFTEGAGPYNGSSLTVLGRNPIMSSDRELPVVGGTGVFRMARGYAYSNTYSFDVEKNYGVLEYTIYVAYPVVSGLASS